MWFGIRARSPEIPQGAGKWEQPVSRSKEHGGRDAGLDARSVLDTHRDLCSCSKALVLPPWPGCSRVQ